MAHVPDHRVVAQNGVAALQSVQHKNNEYKNRSATKREYKKRG